MNTKKDFVVWHLFCDFRWMNEMPFFTSKSLEKKICDCFYNKYNFGVDFFLSGSIRRVFGRVYDQLQAENLDLCLLDDSLSNSKKNSM